MTSPRLLATRSRLASVALDLFESQGYHATSVNDIASAAGVSHMTFFRHFPTKEAVLIDDPYDPVIAAAVAAQPSTLPVIERIARGLQVVAATMGDAISSESRRRLVIAATVPELRRAMAENTRRTEEAIVRVCRADGTDALDARIAAAACLAALTAALLAWAKSRKGARLHDVITRALRTVVPALAMPS